MQENVPPNLGFTLTELIVVMVIFSVLTAMSISGYMGSLRVERRQDAVVSMQNLLININSAKINEIITCPTGGTLAEIDRSNTNPCASNGGFYSITYNQDGLFDASAAGANHPINKDTNSIMTKNEKIILQAVGLLGQTKDKGGDEDCTNIYLSDQNKIYPSYCR